MRIQECFAVKPGINGFLDISRQIFLELMEQMELLVEEYRKRFNSGLRLHYT